MKLAYDKFIIFFDTVATLAYISETTKKRLYDILAAEKSLPKDSCIEQLSMTYSETLDFNKVSVRNITVNPLWRNGTTRPLSCTKTCDANCAFIRDRMEKCSQNLRNGKCQDEFMRRTLGVVLFPQFYGKDKQK